MKTAIKLTALAVITALIALACSEPISLTKRDFSERNEARNPKYTNSPNGNTVRPFFTGTNFSGTTIGSLTYTTTAVPENEAKLYAIRFPVNADVLKFDDASIEAELKKFLTFSQYTNPATNPTLATPPVIYTPSTLTTPVNYTFVRQEARSGSTAHVNVIIKVEVPDIDYIVLKLDSSKYKVYGQLIDFNGDGIGGDIYDDQYDRIAITGSTKNIMDGGAAYTTLFYEPVGPTININLAVSLSGGSFNSTTTTPQLVPLLASSDWGDSNKYYRDILKDVILPNIEFQKYNQTTKAWEKDGTASVALFEGTGAAQTGFPAAWTTDRLYLSYTPVDLGIYRIMVTNLANLDTKANYGASTKPAKISINGSFLNNIYYSNTAFFYNSDVRRWADSDNIFPNTHPIYSVVVKSDANKKNVVLDVFFIHIQDNIAADKPYVNLKEMTLSDFNNSFKLVYDLKNPGTQISGALTGYADNIAELKVVDIKYSASKYYDLSNTNLNCITITLDPSYKIKGDRLISLIASPGFKYASDNITFGSTGAGSFYKGSYFWASYGQVPKTSTLSDGHDLIPGDPAVPASGKWVYYLITDPSTPVDATGTGTTDYNNGTPPAGLTDITTITNADTDTGYVWSGTTGSPGTPDQPAAPPSYNPTSYLYL